MTTWIPWAVYVVGWLPACWVLARYVPDFAYGPLSSHADDALLRPIALGFTALLWPVYAAVALFALPVWLVTRGLDR
ncbi:hypothetical protein [Micromonospora sp. NPDC005174]|uniref:hypothetical protein n=1 Tax=Micromonospora sp. NPDC005174 TaxID=3157018 RepID=UPI0033B293E6